MDLNLFQIGLAIILALMAFVLVTWYWKYKNSRSELRMTTMLMRMGVDPAVARDGDHEAIMRDVRSRCHRCQSEDVCERWLAGSYREDNLFCPNAQVFRALAAEHKQVAVVAD